VYHGDLPDPVIEMIRAMKNRAPGERGASPEKEQERRLKRMGRIFNDITETIGKTHS